MDSTKSPCHYSLLLLSLLRSLYFFHSSLLRNHFDFSPCSSFHVLFADDISYIPCLFSQTHFLLRSTSLHLQVLLTSSPLIGYPLNNSSSISRLFDTTSGKRIFFGKRIRSRMCNGVIYVFLFFQMVLFFLFFIVESVSGFFFSLPLW